MSLPQTIHLTVEEGTGLGAAIAFMLDQQPLPVESNEALPALASIASRSSTGDRRLDMDLYNMALAVQDGTE